MRPNNSRTRLSALVILVVFVLAIAACAEGAQNDPTGRTWQLKTLAGDPVLDETIVDLTIDGDTVSGTAGM